MYSGKLFLYLSIEVFGLFKLHREKTPSLYLFQVSGDENVGKRDCYFFWPLWYPVFEDKFDVKMERDFF